MKLLKTATHPGVIDTKGNTLTRNAARGIVINGDNTLLMFTERYNDYSLPGGGIDENWRTV